ncbi:hypothetical protein ACQP2P_43355 [Dactylosporangium sp. CA-139114]|uniref:hypothetical protein n=1 Tax=Dactylosporangium sp. CA-139114 TaxID=3239931 RepID=UPI003D97C272
MPSPDEALDVFPALKSLLRDKAGFLSGGLADAFVVLDAGEVVRTGTREDLQDPSVRQLLTV